MIATNSELAELRLDFNNTIYHLLINPAIIIDIDKSNWVKINKDGWVINPPSRYRIRTDKPHDEHGKKHIHIYKNSEFIVINDDGTRRHGTEGIHIPKRLRNWLRKNFKDFTIPYKIINHTKSFSYKPVEIYYIDLNQL